MMSIRPETLWPQYITASGQEESRRINANGDVKIPCSILRFLAVPCAVGVMMIGLLLIGGV